MLTPTHIGNAQGMTLVELLISLAVLAISTGIAVSSFLTVRHNTLIRKQINELSHAFFLARQVALDAGTEMAICPSHDGADCDYEAGWHDGWIVFANLDGDDPARVDTGETVFSSGAAAPSLSVTANRQHFVQRPFGRRSTNGTFTVCDPRGAARPRALIVSYTGKPRTAATAASGAPLSCGS